METAGESGFNLRKKPTLSSRQTRPHDTKGRPRAGSRARANNAKAASSRQRAVNNRASRGYSSSGGKNYRGYGRANNNPSQQNQRSVSAPAAAAPGPVTPVVPDIKSFLAGDVGYQDQLRQFGKSLADYLADAGRNRTDIKTQYGVATRDLGNQRTKDLESLKNDYASRGLLESGLYGTSLADYETGYGEQMSELGRTQTRGLEDLLAGENQFRSEQTAASEAAEQEALRRRAAKYGV